MLDEVEAVIKGSFYEDPDPEQGPVEMLPVRDGKQDGEPFKELPLTQKWQVLGNYTPWIDYETAGISYRQINQVFWNVVEGKPREQWLDGTGLHDPGRKKSLVDLKAEDHGEEKQPGRQKTRGKEFER